jgi:eukaryotic-like serine/threonine-protein kinase
VRFGDYEASTRIGAGGMGVILKGAHVRTGHAVAIKQMSAAAGATAHARAAFAREVRAVASMDHPHVVPVHDYGVIETKVGPSPWLAMELSVGSVSDRAPGQWAGVRRLLLQVGSALAHAHARGVVHRDLKPANLLWAHTGNCIWLTDFGIASVADSGRDARRFAGSPAYMAPEQITEFQGQGPWTDIYALGCLTWVLTTGARPFEGDTDTVLRSHLHLPVGAFEPIMAVPSGLEAWIRTCIEKDARRRFQRAADAMAALNALVSAGGNTHAQPRALLEAPTFTLGDGWGEAPQQAGSPGTPDQPPGPPVRAPIPHDWRADLAPRSPATEGLFGLRRLPVLGRGEIQDALWARLVQVTETGQADRIALVGAPGAGKSMLARWLCERAHETGAALTFRAMHGGESGGHYGLAPMIERTYGLTGASASDVLRVLSRRVGHDMALSLLPLLRPRTGSADPVATTSAWLAAEARARPVVVWLDDVHWSPEAAALLAHCSELAAPVLFVATSREPLDMPSLAVGPLPKALRAPMVKELLNLERAAADLVAQLSEGIPLFAVHLVADWLERGLLVRQAGVACLRDPDGVAMPRSTDALWVERVERVLRNSPPVAMEALQLAALLGRDVDAQAMEHACAIAQLAPPETLRDHLIRQGILASEDGWCFIHGLLRDSVLRTWESGGDPSLGAAAVEGLVELGGLATQGKLPHRDGHRAVERAVELQSHASAATIAHCHFQRAQLAGQVGGVNEAYAERAYELAVQAGLPALAVRATLSAVGSFQLGPTKARHLIERASHLELEPHDRARLLFAHSYQAIRAHDFDLAVSLAERASDQLLHAGDEHATGAYDTLASLYNIASFHGRALQAARAGLRAAERLEQPIARARTLKSMGQALVFLDRPAEAIEALGAAAAILRELGHEKPAVTLEINTAMAHAFAGQFEQGRAILTRIATSEHSSPSQALRAQLFQVGVEVQAGELATATALMDALEPKFGDAPLRTELERQRGIVALRCGRLDEAAQWLQGLPAPDPQHGRFMMASNLLPMVELAASRREWTQVRQLADEVRSYCVAPCKTLNELDALLQRFDVPSG